MYPNIEVPFELGSFDTMSKREADHFFMWFLENRKNRIQVLVDYYESTGGGSPKDLDLTTKSLNLLWNWFVPRIVQIKKTSEELAEENEQLPWWIKTECSENEYKLSKETEIMIMDIGLYFGEVLIQQFVQLKWGIIYKPRNFVDVNRPIIVGFNKNMTLNPVRVVNTCTYKAAKGIQSNDLYSLYQIWAEYVE
ncbi:hypothetical protein [Paenibacillus aceti]|uniref:Uncharacterized protein n=1 Tax=Paenibacillus aceti TaxID=1820010 RepID=A0ABQ1W0W0_9BACL|nr:hypothetical protein [Paenibacillus aceti]GGG09031.1 hypothetical protein GCM10010913_33540 [Paenibacillus aceti]